MTALEAICGRRVARVSNETGFLSSLRLKRRGREVDESVRRDEIARIGARILPCFCEGEDVPAIIAKAEMPARLQSPNYQTGAFAQGAQVLLTAQGVDVSGRVALEGHG